MSAFTPPPSASPEPHRKNNFSTLSLFLQKGDLKYLLAKNIYRQSLNLATIDPIPINPNPIHTPETIVIQDENHHIIRNFNSISWQIPSSSFSRKDALKEIGQFALLDTNMLVGLTFSSTARVYKNLVWDKSKEKKETDFPFKKIALVASLLFSAKILNIAKYFKNSDTQEVDKITATNSYSERSVLLLNQENKAGLTDVLPMILRNVNSYTGISIFPYEENLVTISGQNSTKVIISMIADTLFGHSKQKQATEDFLNSMIQANPEMLNATIKYYAETFKTVKVTNLGNDVKVEACSVISQTDDNKIQINEREFEKLIVAIVGATSHALSNNEQPTDYCYLALRDISINETDAFCKQQNAETIKNYDVFLKLINILQNQTQIMNNSEIAFLNPENETSISFSAKNEILNTLKTISKIETSFEVVEFKNITIVQDPFIVDVLKSMNLLTQKEYAYQNYGTELNLLKENGSYNKTVTTVSREWFKNDEQNLTVTVGERELAEIIIANYTEYLPKAIAERIELIKSWKPVKSITAKKKERSFVDSWLIFFALKSDNYNDTDTDNLQHFSILIADKPLKKALEEVIVIFNKNPDLHELTNFNNYVQKYIQDKIKKGELQERKEYTSAFRTFYTGNLFSFLSVRATIERLEQNKLQREKQFTLVGSIVEDIYKNTSIDTLVVILQVHEESSLNEKLKFTENLFVNTRMVLNAVVGNYMDLFSGLVTKGAATFFQNDADTATIYSTTNGSYFPSGKTINFKESAPQNNNFTNSTDENHTGEENKSDWINFVQTYGSQIAVLGTAIYQVSSKNAFNDVLPSLEIIPDNTLYVEKSGYKFKHVVQMIGFVLSLFSKWFLFPSFASQTLTDSAAWISIIDTLNLINGGLIPNLCMHVVNNIALMNSLSLIEKSFELLNPSYVLRRPIKSGSNRKIRNVLDVFFVVWNRRKDLRTLFKPKDDNSKIAFRYLICNLQNMSFVESHQMLIEKDCYYYVDKTLGVVICGLSFFLQQEDGFNPTGMFYTTINLIPFVFNKVCTDNQQQLFELKPYDPIICKEKKNCNEEQMGSFEFWKNNFITPAVFHYIKEDGEYTTLPLKDNFNSASQFVLREFGLINDFIEPVFYWKKTTTNTLIYKLVAYISDEECICYLQNYQSYDNWYSCKNNVVKKIENLNYEEKLDLRGKNVTQLLYEKVDDNKRQPIDVKNGIKLKEIWREKIDKIRNAIKMQVKAEYPTQALNDLKEWEYQTHSNRIHFDCPVKCVLSCQFPEWEKTEIDKMTAKVYADFKRNEFFKNDDNCIDKLQAIDFANQGIELDPHPDQYENACLTTSQLKKIIKELSMAIDTKHEWKKIEYYVWTGDNLVRSDYYSPEEDKLKQLTEFCIVVLPSGFFNGENIVHFLPFKLDNNFSNQLTKN